MGGGSPLCPAGPKLRPKTVSEMASAAAHALPWAAEAVSTDSEEDTAVLGGDTHQGRQVHLPPKPTPETPVPELPHAGHRGHL